MRPNRPIGQIPRMKSYLITDPRYYRDPLSFQSYLTEAFAKHRPDYAAFRDKRGEEIETYAKLFLQIAREFAIEKILINSYLTVAVRLGFDGVHLTSSQFEKITAAKAQGLYTVVSTHTLEEAQHASALGADAVTISPIFATPGKGQPKGIGYLKKFTASLHEVEVFALGGIVSSAEVDALKETGVEGFASIRYFI